MYGRFFKRFFDFIFSFVGFSFVGLVILSPVLIVFIVLLAFANHGKPFFTQLRPGRGERIFRIVKFRTMNDRRDETGNLLPDAQRLTRVGRLVRSTSVDELPQLINVLKGDMSFIGPRPLLEKYLPFYTAQERKRHTVRPGITGWAQVNGRNTLNWSSRLALDVWYVDNISFGLDVRIAWLTIVKVFRKDNLTVDAGQLNFKDLDEERRV